MHNYRVVYFDILGQREILREMTGFPENKEEESIFIRDINNTAKTVDKVREWYKDYFDESANHRPDADLVSSENREDFIESQRTNVSHYSMSDAIVIAVPVEYNNEKERCTVMNSVFVALCAAGGMGLLALSDETPIRAGLDIGLATELCQGDIYGAALVKAVDLEEKEAEYPRLIVGSELPKFLRKVKAQRTTSPFGTMAKELVEYCEEMLTQDTDGRLMLDYLGKRLKITLRGNMTKEIVESAQKFALSQYQEYLKSPNSKLAARYFRLNCYFESRKSIWGLD